MSRISRVLLVFGTLLYRIFCSEQDFKDFDKIIEFLLISLLTKSSMHV